MIKELAKVTAIDNECITVESTVKSSCSGCKQVDSCGSGQIAKAFPQKKLTTKISSSLPVSLGDTVVIGLSEEILIKSAWQVYMWPLIGLILGAFIGQWLIDSAFLTHEIFAILLAIMLGYLGFYCAKTQQGKIANCPQWAPTILKIMPSPISVTEISA